MFVGGSITVSTMRFSAIYKNSPKEICVLLNICRPIVPVVAVGLILTLTFGLWLAGIENSWSEPWLHVSFLLTAWMLIIGGFAGRSDRLTRELAEKQEANDVADAELMKRLRDPINNTLNASMLVAMLVVITMMVFKPGARGTDDH